MPLNRMQLAAGALALCVALAMPAKAEILRQVLPNGLTVILEEDHSRPLTAAALVVKGGSRTETPDLLGLSHYYEHLIFRGGSRDQEELEFRRAMQRLGEESGGYTSDDYTNFGFTAPSSHFEEALRRSTDAWMNLELTQAKVDKERQVVMEEYNQGLDRPDYRLYYSMLESVFSVHPYRISPIGLRKVIEGASLETFRTFYQDRYVPNQMILALVGDFDSASTLEQVKSLWGGYAAGRPSFEQGKIEPEQKEFRFHQETLATSDAKLMLAFPIPPSNHPDLPALELLAALLANGNSSRLWQALKLDDDLVRSVSASAERRLDPGLFEIDAELETESIQDALDRIATALAKLAQTPPVLDELNRARSTLLSDRILRMETPFHRAEALAVNEMNGTAFDVDRYPALLQAVTRQDIARVARQYLSPDKANLVIVRPEGSAEFDPTSWMTDWRAEWSEAVRLGAAAAEMGAPPAAASSLAASASSERSGAAASSASASNKAKTGERVRLGDGVVRVVLPNQLRLLVKPNPSSSVVGAVVMWRGGQWAETPEKAGLANFIAQMLDKGAAGRRQTEIADRLGNLGANLRINGGADCITASLEVPGSGYKDALNVLADVVTQPTFPPEEREKVRHDLLAEIESMPDRPFDYLNQEFYSKLYSRSPYARPVIGTKESVSGITDNDLRDFMQHFMTGSNLVLTVTGPVDVEAVKAWANARFGILVRGAPVKIDSALHETPPAKAIDDPIARDQEQTVYNTGWPTAAFTDPDYASLRAAVGVVADRFFFKYVYDRGVAYRSWFYQTERLGQGSAQNEMGVSPDVYPQVSREVVDDLTHFTRDPIPAEELAAAKDKLVSRHFLGVQTSLSLAQRLAFFELSGRGYEAVDQYPKEIEAVTPEEASAAARKYLVEGRSTRVSIGRAAAAPAP